MSAKGFGVLNAIPIKVFLVVESIVRESRNQLDEVILWHSFSFSLIHVKKRETDEYTRILHLSLFDLQFFTFIYTRLLSLNLSFDQVKGLVSNNKGY